MSTQPPVFSPYQKFVVAMLAFLQFTIVLDFMIISPLGAILMPELKMTPAQFGSVVSAYAFSAGIAGFLAAGFADRFDRKRLLMFFYSGFILGTLFCGLAVDYHTLLVARMITGIFGGVIGSIVMAITTDLFDMNMRGRVMGYIQTSFAASQVLGIPAGMYFSTLWGWHAPFFLIVAVGAVVGGVIFGHLRPIDGHLKIQTPENALVHLKNTLANGDYTLAFLVTALLATGGYMLMPFGSAFAVGNLGVTIGELPLIYLVTGVASIFIGPVVGRLTDRYSKFAVFLGGGLCTCLTVIIYTHLGITPLWLLCLLYVVMFFSIFSRIIPAQALMSAIPAPASRGAFMAVSSSLQQMSGGVASMIAGLIVISAPDGKIERFEWIGYVIVCSVMVTIVMMYFINKTVTAKLARSS